MKNYELLKEIIEVFNSNVKLEDQLDFGFVTGTAKTAQLEGLNNGDIKILPEIINENLMMFLEKKESKEKISWLRFTILEGKSEEYMKELVTKEFITTLFNGYKNNLDSILLTLNSKN